VGDDALKKTVGIINKYATNLLIRDPLENAVAERINGSLQRKSGR
jgi:hypothetical protein